MRCVVWTTRPLYYRTVSQPRILIQSFGMGTLNWYLRSVDATDTIWIDIRQTETEGCSIDARPQAEKTPRVQYQFVLGPQNTSDRVFKK